MEASKCPKCGDEPFFIEHIEKWYCYGCNSYIESDEDHHVHCEAKAHVHEDKADAIASELHALELETKPVCKNCGAVLESVKEGRLYCFICETYPSEAPCKTLPEGKNNEAQSLIDSAVTLPAIEAPVTATVKPVPEPQVVKPAEEHVVIVTNVIEPKPEKQHDIKMCATCGQPMKFIDKYSRYYCYGCRRYAPKDEPVKPIAAPPKAAPAPTKCTCCGGELKYVEKYNEYYCYACKKYPLREKKAPAEDPAPKKPASTDCPKCGQPTKFVEKYSRYYCYNCKDYAPKDFGGSPAEPKEKKVCPSCKEQMKFITEYNEWYCYKCKKYALRPSKPILLM